MWGTSSQVRPDRGGGPAGGASGADRLLPDPGGREKLIRLSAKFPFLRGLYRRVASGRFASVMAMMLSSGYNLDEALELAEDVTADAMVKEKIVQCRGKGGPGPLLFRGAAAA